MVRKYINKRNVIGIFKFYFNNFYVTKESSANRTLTERCFRVPPLSQDALSARKDRTGRNGISARSLLIDPGLIETRLDVHTGLLLVTTA